MEGLVIQSAAALAGSRVLITGAVGFIGRRLTAALVAAGAKVAILETPAANLDALAELQAGITCYAADIRDKAAVCQAVSASQPRLVFHLAAVGVTNPFIPLEQALAVNLHGSINLFEACFQSSDSESAIRVVQAGTPYEYGEGRGQEAAPMNPYAASKAATFAVARMLHRTRNWPIVTVRPFQVYGPGQPGGALIPSALCAAERGEPFHMTGGEQRRDFVFVDDIVHGFLLAATRGADGRSYDLGWGQTHSIREVISRLFAMLKTTSRPQFGALPYRPGEAWNLRADPHSAARDLWWRPQVGLERGLALTVNALAPHMLSTPGSAH